MSTYDDLDRKVRERYGDAPAVSVAEYAVPNLAEGGDGIGVTISFVNSGKTTVYLRSRGLWYESDAVELEGYFAKETEIPQAASDTIAVLNAQKHGVPLAPTPSDPADAATAALSAVKHVAYLDDPTPPDPSPDIIIETQDNG